MGGQSSRTSRTWVRLFRYRSQQISRREVLVIMTPHIMRSEADQARVLAEESARMNWCLPDIARIHGHGMEVMGPASQGAPVVPTGPGMPGMPGPGYYGAMNQPADSGMNPAVPSGAQPSAAQPFNPASAAPMTPTSAMPVGAQPFTVPGGPMTPIAPSAIPPVPVPGAFGSARDTDHYAGSHDSRPAGREHAQLGRDKCRRHSAHDAARFGHDADGPRLPDDLASSSADGDVIGPDRSPNQRGQGGPQAMGRTRTLIAPIAVAMLLAPGLGCKGTGWKEPQGVPSAPLSSQVKPEANPIVQAGGTSPLASLPSSMNWLTGKTSEKAAKGGTRPRSPSAGRTTLNTSPTQPDRVRWGQGWSGRCSFSTRATCPRSPMAS